MKIVSSVKEMREHGRGFRSGGQKVSFVPTMGSLHRGHLALVKKAKKLGDLVVMSIFVNPLQFNDKSDLERYPRNIEDDRKKAEEAGVDYLFVPSQEEMYPPGFLTSTNVSFLSSRLEGQFRPGHFRGVCTIVLKLLNIVQPHFLVLGLKDAQQFTVISHMVEDLCIDVRVVGVATVRDHDGLALSSRNVLLSKQHREQALCIVRAFKRVHFLVKKQGILHQGELLQAIRSALNTAAVETDYAEVVNRTTLEPLDHVVRGGTYVLIAIRVGGVRLIDSTRI